MVHNVIQHTNVPTSKGPNSFLKKGNMVHLGITHNFRRVLRLPRKEAADLHVAIHLGKQLKKA